MEDSHMEIRFSNSFKIQNLPDKWIISLLHNVENRILRIGGPLQFIITRRVSDNRIIKSMVTENNKEQIEDLLQMCGDGQLYDVILNSSYKYENISKIKFRYLNYMGNTFSIYLKISESLLSATLFQVKISNLA